MKEDEKESRRVKPGMFILLGVLILLLIGVIIIQTQFKIEEVQVVGNVHYTSEEIEEKVIGDTYPNTLVLYLKYKLKPMESIPFVEKIDVEYIASNAITITVYEKSMAGCVKFMDEYMYFDKDGIVLESSADRLADIPCIEGIHFDSMVMYEPLPIDDKDFFNTVLNLTQLLQKYNLPVDDVRFTTQNEIVLYYNNIKILLGDGSNIEEQISELPNILASVEGKSGTLYMKDYTIEKGNVIFREFQ